MATVLRLKRFLSEDPAEAIVVHSKRLKGEDENEGPYEETISKPKYFTLIGTVKDDANEKIRELISKANSTKPAPPTYSEWRENTASVQPFKYRTKRKPQQQEVNLEKRLKLLSSRAVGGAADSASDVDATAQSLYKLYDVVDEQAVEIVESSPACHQKPVISCNGVPLITKSNNEVAYDLYYASTDVGDINMLDNIVRIDKCLVEDNYLCVADEVTCSSDEGDEDSNDENNWKNEYPEEDDDFEKEYDYYRDYDDDDEEILDMIQSCNMKDDTLNSSAYSSEVPYDPADHDHRYSRYKLEMMRELGESLTSDEDST